jgi:2-dehydropantoate 2-reductase
MATLPGPTAVPQISPGFPRQPHIAFVGAGAVGGFVGGLMAEAGHDVTLVDPWPEHVERIRGDGLTITGTHGEHRVASAALHVGEVQSLRRHPVDVAVITVKLYDTRWATELIAPYLAAGGFVVTMQNGLIEEQVARIVGWPRVLGCVVSRVQVQLLAPGLVRRSNPPGGDAYTSFRVGEVHGRRTERAQAVADLLASVDSAKVTTNLWGERWSKLVANTMTSPVSAVSGLEFKPMYENRAARRLVIGLAAEAIRVGRSLGFELEPVFGIDSDVYVRADEGEARAVASLEAAMRAWQATSLDGGVSGIAQDLAKGRRTELEYLSGEVLRRAAQARIATPTHVAIIEMIERIERGVLTPGIRNLEGQARTAC